jgi:hypothetical protein
LGTFTGKELIFINMLGANQYVAACYNFHPLIDAEFEGGNSFLFALDIEGNIIIYTAKVTFSKQNSNECVRNLI